MNYIQYIEAKGFAVKGRHIYKRSQKTNKLEVCGILNESSFYMFSENVYPFKHGLNYFENKTLVDYSDLKKYVSHEIKKERNDFNISFEQFNDSSSNTSNLISHYNSECRKYLARPFINYFDVKNYEDFTAFPFIDYNGNFKTAQLIKYNDTGNRIKQGYSTTWLHSHKQAKKRLGLKVEDKYSVKINCFYGEHYLKDSTKPIAIVEAPKTATILKMMHPKIDWIATAGEGGLFNKDLSVLKDRNVIFYADCGTTQWKEFAQKNGYSYSDVLERNNCKEGTDLADFIFDSSHEAYTDIHSELYAISENEFNFKYNTDLLELNFKNSNKSVEYFTAVPMYYKGIQIRLKQDNKASVKKVFQDKYFEVYDEKFNLINAQLDWHKQTVLKGGKLRGFSEKEFIKTLQECYSALKHLNKDADVKNIFSVVLDNIISGSNIAFNPKFIMNRLIPIWEDQEQNLMQFVKQRNWSYRGNIKLSRNEFITELNNTRFRVKFKSYLKRFKELIKAGEYIPSEAIFNNRVDVKRGLNEIDLMRKDWNKKVLGCSTKKQAEKLHTLFKCYENVTTTYKLDLYSGYKNVTLLLKNQGYTAQILSDSLGFTRQAVSSILKFKRNVKTENRIMDKLNTLEGSLTLITPIRTTDKNGKKRITDFNIVEDEKETLITLDVDDAFSELDLEKIAV